MMAGSFFSLYSQDNIKRFVIKTQHFDVIYKEPSRQTANLIAENIEEIYHSIRKDLDAEECFEFKRFPVYIEFSTDELNAYYTTYPFRHIVMYDTVASHNLALFENNILAVLKHELTHAVSLNVRNKGKTVFGKAFYFIWSTCFYSVPSSISEGIAVQNESQNGYGRLNDPFSTHVLKQAKIENCFPEYQNISGSRDIYPSGNLPYIFGGAFTEFIIEKYGKEKYKDYLYKLNNHIVNYFYCYKAVFNNEIKNDYKEFVDSISIPQVTVNASDTEGIFDFHTITSCKKNCDKKINIVSKSTSYISSEDSGTAWFCADSGQVWFYIIKKNQGKQNKNKPEKLFVMTGINKISFSSDGKYLVISRTLSYETRKNIVDIYDMEKKKFYRLGSGYRDATVLAKDSSYIVAAVKTLSQDCKIDLFNIENNGKFSYTKSIDFNTGEIPLDLNDAGNFTLTFLLKKDGRSFISLYNKELDENKKIKIPEDIYIRDLAPVVSSNFVTGQQGRILCFSYGKKGTLPRLGFLSLKSDGKDFTEAKLHLQLNDISGGVYSPSVFIKSNSKKLPSVVFVSQYFDHSKLSVMDTDCFEFEQIPVIFEKSVATDIQKDVNEYSPLKKVNSLQHSLKGFFVPLSLVPLYDQEFNIKRIGFLGGTWHAKNYHFSAGYEPFGNLWGVTTSVYNTSPSKNSTLVFSGHAAFKGCKFNQTEDEVKFNYYHPVFKHSNIIVSSTTKFFTGYPEQFYNIPAIITTAESEDAYFTTIVNQEVLEFSTLHKTGNGEHQVAGFYTGAFFNYTFMESPTKFYKGKGVNIGLQAGFKLPNIIPFDNPENITVNLPLSVSASIFPDIKRFVNFESSIVLFSMEVQNGTENFFLPLYLNRFYFTAGYSGGVYYKDSMNMALCNLDIIPKVLESSYYADYVSLGFVLGFTLNTGYLQQAGVLNFGFDLLYEINQKIPNTNRIHLKLCSQLVF